MTNGLGEHKERGVAKISADMASLCYNKIPEDLVKTVCNQIIYLLTFLDFQQLDILRFRLE